MRGRRRPDVAKGKRSPQEGGHDQMSYANYHQVGSRHSRKRSTKALTETGSSLSGDNGHERRGCERRGHFLNFGFMATVKNFNVQELAQGKRVVWQSRKGKVTTNGRRLKSPLIYIRMRRADPHSVSGNQAERKSGLSGSLRDEMGRLFVEPQRRAGERKRAARTL